MDDVDGRDGRRGGGSFGAGDGGGEDALDGLLRATFRDREPEATDVSGLATAARSGHARRTVRRRQMAAVGTVGMLAVGASSALALGRLGSGGSSGITPAVLAVTEGKTSASTRSPLPSGGTRPWSSHGLQVRVPEAWKANQTRCGTPIANTVLIGEGATTACKISDEPPVDVVGFGKAQLSDLSPAPKLHPTSVDGQPAQAGETRLPDGRTYAVLVVPGLDVSVTVTSKNFALVGEILATAQIVDTDANGCPTRATLVEPSGKPSHPDARTTMVPGTPVKAIACHYGASFSYGNPTATGPTLLTNGSEIPPDEIRGLTEILNSLTPGLATWQGLAGSCASPAHDGYLLRFSYPSGDPVDVYLHTSDCDQMGFSNGAVTGLIPQKFIEGSQKYLPDMGLQVAGEAMSK